MNSQSSDKKWAYLALIVAFFAFSTSAILIRWSSSEPLVIGSYRQTFATLLFLPFLFKDRFKEITSLSLNETAELIVIGILLGAHFGFWISSVKATSVAASVLLDGIESKKCNFDVKQKMEPHIKNLEGRFLRFFLYHWTFLNHERCWNVAIVLCELSWH